MATLRSLVLVSLVACDSIQGFSGPTPPFARIQVEVTGDASTLPDDVDLKIALVWGRQWLVEALCILPPESSDAATVLAAGCRDPLGFVPARVDTNLAVVPNTPAELDLFTLPTSSVLVGDLTARVGYASLIAYDDRDHDGTLTLARPNRFNGPPGMGGGSGGDLPTDQRDVVVGGSFVAMTQPDQRIGYREGEFSPVAAFYPRAGCGDPPKGFSILAAGGFSQQAAIDATLAGTLPMEDPAACGESAIGGSPVLVPLQPAASVRELGCTERTSDSSVRYLDPAPADDGPPMPDFTDRTFACVHLPSFGAPSDTTELVVTGRTEDACVGLSHYILKGCREAPDCGSPDWDHSLSPPSWWPCGP